MGLKRAAQFTLKMGAIDECGRVLRSVSHIICFTTCKRTSVNRTGLEVDFEFVFGSIF